MRWRRAYVPVPRGERELMDECTCYAPDDAEPEDHDSDCPLNPGTDEEEV